MSEPVGIIHPPPDLRGIVDSTAKYVAKNGGAFEERIKREHRGKPKFSFLFSDDPFNAYYQFKVKEIKNSLIGSLDSTLPQTNSSQAQSETVNGQNEDGPAALQYDGKTSDRSEATSANRQDEPEAQYLSQPQDQEATQPECQAPSDEDKTGDGVRSRLKEFIEEMNKDLEEPPALNYLATSAPSLTSMDCDIIKLTAQFISNHGRSFLLELVSREQNNSQFDFLKPQHGQFTYMTNLIMQYAIIRNQPLDIHDQLKKDATSQKSVLDRMKMRAEWNKMLELEKKRQEEAEEREKVLYSQIDWHDFVVVETINYQPDERGEYPPTTADQVGTRLLLQQRYEEQTVPEEMDIDMDVDSGDEEQVIETEPTQDNNFSVTELSDLLPPKPGKVVIRKDYDPKATTKAPTMALK